MLIALPQLPPAYRQGQTVYYDRIRCVVIDTPVYIDGCYHYEVAVVDFSIADHVGQRVTVKEQELFAGSQADVCGVQVVDDSTLLSRLTAGNM